MFLHHILRSSSLFAILITGAVAQPVADTTIAASGTEQITPDLQFKSAFSDYVPYSEQAIESWRKANDTVAEIGGWKTYAREAHQPDIPAAQPKVNDSSSAAPASKGGN